MKFVGKFNDANQLVDIIVDHGDEEPLRFGAKISVKRVFIEPENLFAAVNALLENYNETEHRQLFGYYHTVFLATMHRQEFSDLQRELEEVLLGIFSIILPQGIEAWSHHYPEFKVPEVIKDDRSEGNYPKSTTYTKADYRALCGLSTMFKLILPISTAFMSDFNAEYQVRFKEYRMLKLLDELEMEELSSYAKLTAIVQDSNVPPMGLITLGIGATEYPKYILGSKLIRDLALSETDVAYRERGEANNLTAKLSNGITTAIAAAMKEHEYRDKEPPSDRPGVDGGNTTKREDEQGQEEFSALYATHYDAPTSDAAILQHLDVDSELYYTFLNHIENADITESEAKFTVLGMIIHGPLMPAQAQELILAQATRRIYAGVCAKLHELGLYGLVNWLLTRDAPESVGSTIRDMRHFAASRYKVDAVLEQEVRACYYENMSGTETIITWVDGLVEKLCRAHLKTCSPVKLGEQYEINTDYVPATDMKAQLMQLAYWMENGKLVEVKGVK